MKNVAFFLIGICWALVGTILYDFYFPYEMGSQSASVAEVLSKMKTSKTAEMAPAVPVKPVNLSIAGVSTESICDNFQDIKEFDYQVSVAWTARLDGCLVNCNGASFTRLPESKSYDYPRFAGYYKEGVIPEEFLGKDLTLKVYGNWLSVSDNYFDTIFGNKCVPVVEIEKIEIAD